LGGGNTAGEHHNSEHCRNDAGLERGGAISIDHGYPLGFVPHMQTASAGRAIAPPSLGNTSTYGN
jgi:hypothetical protein